MAICSAPGCIRTDGEYKDHDYTLYFERVEYDGTGITTCEKHVDHDNPTVELTDGVKEVPVGTLDHIVAELTDHEV
jgi:hypothetical protein